MTFRKTVQIVQEPQHMDTVVSDVERARRYADELIRREAAVGSRTLENALFTVSRRTGLTQSFLKHLRSGRAKEITTAKFRRLQRTYYEFLGRLIEKMQHEHEVLARIIESENGGVDQRIEDEMASIEDAISRLKEQARARRQK